jgi:hypothetical protein
LASDSAVVDAARPPCGQSARPPPTLLLSQNEVSDKTTALLPSSNDVLSWDIARFEG